MEVFEIVSNTTEQVVLKVNAEDNLVVAMHPYISRDYDYITITKGDNHILTIIYKDGHTFNFNWGLSGYTLISEGLKRLKGKCISFLNDNGVDLR